MLDSQCIKFFLGLQEKDHIIREEVGKIFHIVVSSDTTEQFCPKCGCATKYIKGYYNQTVKAGYLSGIPIEVVLRKRRYARLSNPKVRYNRPTVFHRAYI